MPLSPVGAAVKIEPVRRGRGRACRGRHAMKYACPPPTSGCALVSYLFQPGRFAATLNQPSGGTPPHTLLRMTGKAC